MVLKDILNYPWDFEGKRVMNLSRVRVGGFRK